MLRNLVIASLMAFSAAAATLPAQAVDQAKDAGAGQEHKKWDPAKAEEFRAKRQEEVHKLLHLSAAQESAWQTYLSKTKMTPHTPHSREEWMAMEKLSEPEKMEKMLAHFKEMEAHMQTHLSALKELYAQLSPEQRTIFELSHKLEMSHHHGGWMHGHGGPGMHGPGGPGMRGPGGPGMHGPGAAPGGPKVDSGDDDSDEG